MRQLSPSVLLGFYRRMYLIRRAEDYIIRHYAENEMKTPMHMSVGEEAIVTGVTMALAKRDLVFGTYRSHGLYLAKTGETDKFFAELYGKVAGSARGKAGSMHLALPEKGLVMTSAVVGTTIPVAVGAALAQKYQGSGRTVAVFFGDGALHEGVFWESLNFACLKRLPILFVCEDNNFAIHSSMRERAGHRPIAEVVSKFFCHAASLRTTDAVKIYHLTAKTLKKMARDGKPGFLHLQYYRYLEHVGVQEDFRFGYRSKREFLRWKKVDPLVVARRRLLRVGIPTDKIAAIEHQIDRQVERSARRARKAPSPPPQELFAHVYAP